MGWGVIHGRKCAGWGYFNNFNCVAGRGMGGGVKFVIKTILSVKHDIKHPLVTADKGMKTVWYKTIKYEFKAI